MSKLELIPQAILNRPLSYFQKQLHVEIIRGEDDLDVFDGVALSIDGRVRFALKHYPGYPDNTTTIYLSREFKDVGEISRLVELIVDELQLPQEAVFWQRSDNPDL